MLRLSVLLVTSCWCQVLVFKTIVGDAGNSMQKQQPVPFKIKRVHNASVSDVPRCHFACSYDDLPYLCCVIVHIPAGLFLPSGMGQLPGSSSRELKPTSSGLATMQSIEHALPALNRALHHAGTPFGQQ